MKCLPIQLVGKQQKWNWIQNMSAKWVNKKLLIDRHGEQQLTVIVLTCKITALESLEIYKKNLKYCKTDKKIA